MLRMDSANILAGPAQLQVTPGQYAALFLRISGTNQAGQTLTAANCGLITAYKDGRPWASVSVADLQIINNIDLGLVEAASAAGGAFAYSCVLQASRVQDGNVFDFVQDDDALVSIDLAGVTGVIVAAGTVELFGIPMDGVQKYIPQLFTNTPNIAAGTVAELHVKYENVSHIYFTTPANLQNIAILKDRVGYVNCTWADLIAFSNQDNRLEAAFTTGAMVNMHRSGAISESLSDDISLTLIAGGGGASTPHVVCVSLDFTPDALARSAAVTNNKAQSVFKRKIKDNRGRPVTVAKQIAPQSVQA